MAAEWVAWAVWISKATGFKRSKEIGSGSDAGPFCVSYVRGRLHTGSDLFRGAADDGIAAGEPTECFNPTAVVMRAEALSRKAGHVGAVAMQRSFRNSATWHPI